MADIFLWVGRYHDQSDTRHRVGLVLITQRHFRTEISLNSCQCWKKPWLPSAPWPAFLPGFRECFCRGLVLQAMRCPLRVLLWLSLYFSFKEQWSFPGLLTWERLSRAALKGSFTPQSVPIAISSFCCYTLRNVTVEPPLRRSVTVPPPPPPRASLYCLPSLLQVLATGALSLPKEFFLFEHAPQSCPKGPQRFLFCQRCPYLAHSRQWRGRQSVRSFTVSDSPGCLGRETSLNLCVLIRREESIVNWISSCFESDFLGAESWGGCCTVLA